MSLFYGRPFDHDARMQAARRPVSTAEDFQDRQRVDGPGVSVDANCVEPVARDFLAPDGKFRKIDTVLLATDLTFASDVATDQAIDLAASIGARLLVVNVIAPVDATARAPGPFTAPPRVDQQRAQRESKLLAIVDRARRRSVTSAFLLWSGEPGAAIVAAAEAEGADLIVVGTRGLDDAGRFLLGSVSDHVVYHSKCPVLVAH
jgi:nucleotide-binding universal stress UspA family protein